MKTIKARVLMLPSSEEFMKKSDNSVSSGNILFTDGKRIGSIFKDNSYELKEQFLYIIVDKEIKKGDWYVNRANNTVCHAVKRYGELRNPLLHKKIIATTDKLPYPLDDKRTIWNSFLPQIPQSFVKKYCEAGGIENVLIEYEEYLDQSISEHGCYRQRTKVNSHNEITIHPIKDSWDKQEIESKLFELAEHYGMMSTKSEINDFNNWIKENL